MTNKSMDNFLHGDGEGEMEANFEKKFSSCTSLVIIKPLIKNLTFKVTTKPKMTT